LWRHAVRRHSWRSKILEYVTSVARPRWLLAGRPEEHRGDGLLYCFAANERRMILAASGIACGVMAWSSFEVIQSSFDAFWIARSQ